MRALLLAGLVASAFAVGAPADAACVGTDNLGLYCVEVSFGPRREFELQEHHDCVHVGVDPCIPVTYYTPPPMRLDPPTVERSCSGVFHALLPNC